MEITDLIN